MKRRLLYMDAMRGFAILMVVLGHLLGNNYENSVVRGVVYSFHMPLFFFISGFCAEYARKSIPTIQDAGNVLWRKFVSILWPYLLWGGVIWPFCLHNPVDSWHSLQDMGIGFLFKWEYWFLPCLFVYSCCHLLFSVADEWWLQKRPVISRIGVAGALVAFIFALHFIFGSQLTKRMACYVLPFCVGVLSVRWNGLSDLICKNRLVLGVAVATFIGLCGVYATAVHASLVAQVTRMLCGLSMVVICMQLFPHLEKCVRISKSMAYIGRNTMGIYLLHFYLLEFIALPIGLNEWLLAPIGLVYAAVVTAICLMVTWLIDRNVVVRKVLLGK